MSSDAREKKLNLKKKSLEARKQDLLRNHQKQEIQIEVIGQFLSYEDLLKREEKFRTLAENAPDIIARFDRNLRHIYVNDRTARVLGVPKKEIIGKTHPELGYDEKLINLWQQKIRSVFVKKKKAIMEYQIEVAEGKRYFESSLVPEFDKKGDVVTVLGITRDVTHFREYEQKINELNKQLEQKNRALNLVNKELKSFTFSVSHDLRAPLRSIKGFTEAEKGEGVTFSFTLKAEGESK